MTASVDRSSPLPLYIQLEAAMLEHIRTQKLRPGDRLPTEAEIAATYAVSRATIRQSLNRLVTDGHVERLQGLGSFVAKPRPVHQTLLNSFTENMRAQGYEPQRRVLRSETVQAPSEVQDQLRAQDGECQYIERLFLADDRPIGLSRTWLPVESLAGRLDLFAAATLGSSSLYELLQGQDIGMVLRRGVETVRAGLASADEARLLEYGAGSPTLVVRRVSFSRSGRPVEWTVMTFAADRYEYRVELSRPSP